MNGVVRRQRDERAIGTLDADQTDLPVHGAIGIEAEADLSVHVPGPAVEVGQGHSQAGAQAGRFQFVARVLDCLDDGRADLRGVFAIPLVIGAAFQEDLIYAGRSYFGGGVSVRDGPPELLSFDACLLKCGRHLVVEFGREEAQVARHQEELGAAIVERDHAMVDAVVHSGGFAGTIA